jgi:hypothetical protein
MAATVMRFMNVLLVMALFAPGIALADELDGYLWERMDATHKILLMAGYVNGFWHGTVYGADFGVNTSSKYLKDLSGSSVYGVRIFKDYAMCGTRLDKNREIVLKDAAKYARKSLNESIDYYVAEVDSFYRKYPLCKAKDLMAMLTDISLAWLRIRSYQDIGEECSHKSDGRTREGRPDGEAEKRRTNTGPDDAVHEGEAAPNGPVVDFQQGKPQSIVKTHETKRR